MKNIFKIYGRDLKKIFTNSMAIILAVGIAVIPSLYAWFNIFANWDPYGSTGNMQVAVIIEDEGYTFKEIEINVGEEIRSNLEANDLIDCPPQPPTAIKPAKPREQLHLLPPH